MTELSWIYILHYSHNYRLFAKKILEISFGNKRSMYSFPRLREAICCADNVPYMYKTVADTYSGLISIVTREPLDYNFISKLMRTNVLAGYNAELLNLFPLYAFTTTITPMDVFFGDVMENNLRLNPHALQRDAVFRFLQGYPVPRGFLNFLRYDWKKVYLDGINEAIRLLKEMKQFLSALTSEVRVRWKAPPDNAPEVGNPLSSILFVPEVQLAYDAVRYTRAILIKTKDIPESVLADAYPASIIPVDDTKLVTSLEYDCEERIL